MSSRASRLALILAGFVPVAAACAVLLTRSAAAQQGAVPPTAQEPPAPTAPPPPAPAPAAKPKGGRELCLKCHADFGARLSAGVLHQPVAADRCSDCHDPHAARHGRLLRDEQPGLCLGCHGEIGRELEREVPHKALREEASCGACHEPHGSAWKGLLAQEPSALCGSCHGTVLAQTALRHPHAPAAGGECVACHEPHGAAGLSLLARDSAGLCANCHDAGAAALRARHRGFALAGSDCLSCHAPHGTADPALVRAVKHAPFAEGSCETCHTAPGRPRELAAPQPDLCLACHSEETYATRRLTPSGSAGGAPPTGPMLAVLARPAAPGASHAVGGPVLCTACHSPHAGDGEEIMRGRPRNACLSCHTAISEAMSRGASTHPVEVEDGRCSGCHEAHEAPGGRLLKSDRTQVCLGCHEDHATFAHPMGPNVPDPRREGESVSCLSCHDPHASAERKLLLGSPDRELCVGCHQKMH